MRVVLEDGSAATWVFAVANPEQQLIGSFVLLTNLGIWSASLRGWRLTAIIDGRGETPRYEIDEAEASVRVIGPDGRRTRYEPVQGIGWSPRRNRRAVFSCMCTSRSRSDRRAVYLGGRDRRGN